MTREMRSEAEKRREWRGPELQRRSRQRCLQAGCRGARRQGQLDRQRNPSTLKGGRRFFGLIVGKRSDNDGDTNDQTPQEETRPRSSERAWDTRDERRKGEAKLEASADSMMLAGSQGSVVPQKRPQLLRRKQVRFSQWARDSSAERRHGTQTPARAGRRCRLHLR